LVWRIKLIIGDQQSSTSLGEGHFKIVGSLEAGSKRLYWDSNKGLLVVPKVNLQSITKPTRSCLRSTVLKDWLWHTSWGRAFRQAAPLPKENKKNDAGF